MGTTILSFSDRIVIETLRHEKRSLRYIADYLGFSKTTIFNEIHRLKGEYHATSAQADHETKLSYRGRKCSLTANLKRLIEDKIKIQKWSIEQVAHVVRIAYKTIYNWVDQGLLDIRMTDLPDHGIRRKRAKETRGTFSMDIWDKLTTETQEKAVGRKKFSDLELPDGEKFKNAHNVASQAKIDGVEQKIVRMNVPYSDPASGITGTYFIGYSRYWKVTKLMLENMLKNGDYLLTFSDILSGQLFFIPSRPLLDKIADGELNK